jgi:Leucine-rich repeat (LRR) protein
LVFCTNISAHHYVGTSLYPDPRLDASIVLDILRIDNLWQFENLQKLQLNNNIIERIEGLENLTQLVWLGKGLGCVCPD